VQKGKRGG